MPPPPLPPPWPLSELGKLFAVQNSTTVSRYGCEGNVAQEGECVLKLKGLCSDKDVRNCNGKRVVEVGSSVESTDFGSCGVDGVKRARPLFEKMGHERNRLNRWGVDSANGGMKQSQFRQSVEGRLGD